MAGARFHPPLCSVCCYPPLSMADAALPPLIQAMQTPEFYPHPVESPIRLMQTHVSYVLLTGEFAYKVKKPVNFGFLDYSTLEQRAHFCREELRLNQRTAADLYLEVVPIGQTTDGWELATAGTPVEYAVKMVQFPQTALLSALQERGELTPTLMQQFAGAVADFHQQAASDEHIRSYGTVAQVRQAFDENYAQTQQYVGGPQTEAQLAATQAYTDQFFTTQGDLFQRRIDEHKIRACHGDLHLGNICYWQDQLRLFDCIEFNEPFRFVDVMYDVGFVVMDLTARGCPDLATVFLNHYVERTGDWDGLQLLPLYVSRQAYVRAKVTSFLLDDPSVDAATKQRASEQAAQYYRLAWEAVQTQPGQIYVMAGLSGSGKTTAARHIAQAKQAIHLRSDAVRKHLAGVPLDRPGDAALYTPEMSDRTYQRLLDLGLILAAAGFSVVLDAKYDRQPRRQAAIKAAAARKLPLRLVHCQAPAPVLEARVAARTGDIADATVAVLQQQSMDPFTPQEAELTLNLDTTQPMAPQLAAL